MMQPSEAESISADQAESGALERDDAIRIDLLVVAGVVCALALTGALASQMGVLAQAQEAALETGAAEPADDADAIALGDYGLGFRYGEDSAMMDPHAGAAREAAGFGAALVGVTAAHPTLPVGSSVTVERLDGGGVADVEIAVNWPIDDPWAPWPATGTAILVSGLAAQSLGIPPGGSIDVLIQPRPDADAIGVAEAAPEDGYQSDAIETASIPGGPSAPAGPSLDTPLFAVDRVAALDALRQGAPAPALAPAPAALTPPMPTVPFARSGGGVAEGYLTPAPRLDSAAWRVRLDAAAFLDSTLLGMLSPGAEAATQAGERR